MKWKFYNFILFCVVSVQILIANDDDDATVKKINEWKERDHHVSSCLSTFFTLFQNFSPLFPHFPFSSCCCWYLKSLDMQFVPKAEMRNIHFISTYLESELLAIHTMSKYVEILKMPKIFKFRQFSKC